MYVGLTWYEQSWLPAPNHSPESLSQDYTNTYYLHPDGTTITAFVNGRDPPDLTKCFYYTEQFRITGAPGKWLRKRGDRTTDYWIVSTDYTSYSVAYGCQEQYTLGNCAVPLVWVWSRAPDILPKGTINIVDNILDALCVNKSAFLETDQTHECSEQEECRIYSIDSRRQQNFDIRRYAGKWYEMSWLPQSFIPADQLFQDYQHVYDLSSDGTFLTGFIRGRDPADLSKCFYNQGQLMPTTGPGKFVYRRKVNATHVMTTDYWVMSTDYVNYAVVYGCRKFDETGRCTYADSWIWSRFPTLPASAATKVENVKKTLCVNATMYLPTQQTNECSKDRDCTVLSITQRAMENFNLTQLQGLWYRYSFLSMVQSETFTDFVMVIGQTDSNIQTADTNVRYINQDGHCRSEKIVIHQSNTVGKLRTTRTTSTGIVQRDSYVMGTDYTSYYVEYSCLGQDGNSKCSNPTASLWTRTLILTPKTL